MELVSSFYHRHASNISRQIHPAILDDLGLVDAIKSECKTFSQREEIDVEYNTNNIPSFIPKNIAITSGGVKVE